MTSVPFEALDVQFNNKIILDLDHIYAKVVDRHRRGYCYELNYLFHSLLETLGFKSRMVSLRIYNEDILGPAFDHMAVLVELEELWLVDVGYGDLFTEPLQVETNEVQKDDFKQYKIQQTGGGEYLLSEALIKSANYQKRYAFDLQSRSIEEFADQNEFKQSSPLSHFVKNRICTLPTNDGRKTIMNDLYKVKSAGNVNERIIDGEEDLLAILREEFRMQI